MLQRVFHISRARLYRILQPEGGVTHVIARARTDAAFRDIRHRPDQPLRQVAGRIQRVVQRPILAIRRLAWPNYRKPTGKNR
mgnify:CR=1 FL=1